MLHIRWYGVWLLHNFMHICMHNGALYLAYSYLVFNHFVSHMTWFRITFHFHFFCISCILRYRRKWNYVHMYPTRDPHERNKIDIFRDTVSGNTVAVCQGTHDWKLYCCGIIGGVGNCIPAWECYNSRCILQVHRAVFLPGVSCTGVCRETGGRDDNM